MSTYRADVFGSPGIPGAGWKQTPFSGLSGTVRSRSGDHHNNIILQKLLVHKKTRTFIRYLKGIGRSHPHGHKIQGLSRLFIRNVKRVSAENTRIASKFGNTLFYRPQDKEFPSPGAFLCRDFFNLI